MTYLLFSKKRIILFVGGYGSGKTEVAVNYALAWRPLVPNLAIADLDVVNPYFRSRERHTLVSEADIKVLAPAGAWASADLPALPPEVGGVLQDELRYAVFDVGGDDVGARVLGRYSPMFPPDAYEMYFVFNQHRPFSKTEGTTKTLLRSIEKTARLKVTGIVNNTNLMSFTDLPVLEAGEEAARVLAESCDLPLVFNAVSKDLAEAAAEILKAPILPLGLYMKRPWE